MAATKRKTRQAINISGNTVYTSVEDGWQAYLPAIDLSAVGATQDEAQQALRAAIPDHVNNGSDELRATWQRFCENNIIDQEMTPEMIEEERSIRARLAEMHEGAAHGFRAVSPTSVMQIAAHPTPVLVDFWAAWCQPCLLMMPVVERVAGDLGIEVVSADVEAHESFLEQFELRGVPTMVLFREGRELGRITGARSADELRGELETLLRS